MLNENTTRVGNRIGEVSGGVHAGGWGSYFYVYAPVYWKSATVNVASTGSTVFSIYYNINSGTDLGSVDDTKTLTFTSTGEQDVDLGWYFPTGFHAFKRDSAFNMHRDTSIDSSYEPTAEIDFVGGTDGSSTNTYYYYLYDIDYVKSNSIGKDKLIHSPNFSEVGPVDGLIGYWPMNGNLLDYSLYNNDGTTGGATVVGGFAPRDKYCYELLTATDQINLDDIITLSAGEEWSLSFWGYKDSYVFHGIGGNRTTTSDGWIFFVSGGVSLVVETTNDSGALTTSGYPTGEWFHLVLTHTSGNLITVYLNGSAGGTDTVTGDILFSRIGDVPDSSGFDSFTGYMFDFRIYNKVLTVPEITVLHKIFTSDVNNSSQLSNDMWYVSEQFKEQL